MVQVTLNLNACKTCTHRKLACDTLVAYEKHAKPCTRKDMRVLAYTRVYRMYTQHQLLHAHVWLQLLSACTRNKSILKKSDRTSH